MGKRKNKSPLVAILIGGGVLAYFLFIKKDSGSGGSPVADDGSGTGDTAPPPPPPPVYQTGLDSGLVNDVLTNQSITDMNTYYNTVYSLPSSVFIKVAPVMQTLKSQGKITELKAIADYITNYLSKGVPLSRTAANAALYDQLMAIHATYGIF